MNVKDGLPVSLRDWFAGQALAALCVNYATPNGLMGDPDQLTAIYASHAYQLADAMIAEREKAGPS